MKLGSQSPCQRGPLGFMGTLGALSQGSKTEYLIWLPGEGSGAGDGLLRVLAGVSPRWILWRLAMFLVESLEVHYCLDDQIFQHRPTDTIQANLFTVKFRTLSRFFRSLVLNSCWLNFTGVCRPWAGFEKKIFFLFCWYVSNGIWLMLPLPKEFTVTDQS